ncbi:cholecystokinin receptor-like [Sinocyclocheilus rhinocerous]|uniref:cholecystokinin receptor-like n=1 Tax=Sinocyclocheilus rhinocerous TaxID=307959 RepID=UPI0007B9046F|nr:PREDICTED: cholecystokinin receptor-like [Sinocyclocheilus rhinocerous]
MDLQTLNDTFGIWACLQLQNSSVLNGTLNGSLEIPNGTCGDALLLPKTEPARPKEMDSLRILLYSLIFLLSVFGNLLIIVVLVVNKRMRTVTNSFLLSLAISDLMMAVFCMPFTLIPNLLEDFIFGAAMCKIVAYLMEQNNFFALDILLAYGTQGKCILLLFVLFFIPGVVMIIAYGLISRELFRGIQFEMEQKKGQSGMKNGISATVLYSSDDGDGCYIQVSKRPNSMEMSAITPTSSAKVDRPRINTSEAKLMAKKRVIRMLIVIVAMFFICWMPLYSVNTWKAFDLPSAHRALSGAPISFIHLLSYTSACVNPIIYCFMNKRFRKVLLTTFSCCCWPCHRKGFREGDDEVTATGASMSKFNYSTVSTMGPC